jgi:hypothetical protein
MKTAAQYLTPALLAVIATLQAMILIRMPPKQVTFGDLNSVNLSQPSDVAALKSRIPFVLTQEPNETLVHGK